MKIDKEKKKKKELHKAQEYIKDIEHAPGGEAERKIVIDDIKEDEKTTKKAIDDIKTDLESKKKTRFSYRRSLADYGNWLLEEITQEGWELTFVPTTKPRVKIYGRMFNSQEGILLVLKNPLGGVYVRGFRTSYVPDWDENALRVLYIQAENTVDSYKGILLSDRKVGAGTKIITA